MRTVTDLMSQERDDISTLLISWYKLYDRTIARCYAVNKLNAKMFIVQLLKLLVLAWGALIGSSFVVRGRSACLSTARFSEPVVESALDGKTPKVAFKPKQSLGQNYLSDQNYVLKICNALGEGVGLASKDALAIASDSRGARVVELGPGAGALSRVLHERYPDMLAIELDDRAVALLAESLPALTVLKSDVLQVDYRAVAELRGGPLVVVGNLPYYITSQILFSFVDCAPSVRRAVVTMQWEVAQRLVAKPRSKDYGILSVVFQLYASPKVNFKIPPTVFYPAPKVDSALCTIDFPKTREPFSCSATDLRRVITTAFQQRRKMLRQSLKELLVSVREDGTPIVLPEALGARRPEELEPKEFVILTELIFGPKPERAEGESRVWRHLKHGDW